MSIASDVAKVPEIFRHLAGEGQVASLRDRNGVYEFDIADGGGTWYLNLDHGNPKLAETAEHPNVVITCTPADFIAMSEGSQNVVTAFLQGRITCTGDLAFALDVRRLFPVPA